MDVQGADGAPTFGVEEEYHLVDPETYELAPRPDLTSQAADRTLGPVLRGEMVTSQLEAATGICHTLTELRTAIVDARREAQAAAAEAGATLLATSSHPFAMLSEVGVLDRPRYAVLIERFGTVVRALNLTGCHVHVSVSDRDTAIAVLTRVRAYLPLLAALTGSSAFHEGKDTEYASFRLAWLGLWPQGGIPPSFSSSAEYDTVVADIVGTGLVGEESELLWEVRPSSSFPTIEYRIADMCTEIDDAVLYAALARSLTRTLSARLDRPEPTAPPSDAFLRAVRWRAARYGLEGDLWSAQRHALVPAAEAVEDLLAELRADLEAHHEWDDVRGLTDAVLARGTSARRQRSVYTQTGDLREVTRDAVVRTSAG